MSEFTRNIHHEKEPEQELPLVGEAVPVRDDQIPPEYSLFQRDVRLLNGNVEPAFYSTRSDHTPSPAAWEKIAPSLIDGFTWALQVPKFLDETNEDDDRTQEIGNMMSYALSQGLTEEQVLECYRQAFATANETV